MVSPNFPSAYNSQDSCTVVIDEAWFGVLDVRHFDTEHGQDVLYVNQHPVSGNYYGLGGHSIYKMQKMTPSGTIVWTGWKLCPSAEVLHPWSGEVWTCKHTGQPCQFPFHIHPYSHQFNSCTEYFSDFFNVDGSGNVHDGFPFCVDVVSTDSKLPVLVSSVACGPCSCGPGEEQRYVSYSLPTHGEKSFISCAPCAAGRFKSVGGYGVAEACSVCPSGFASDAGATACDACGLGFFSGGGVSDCSACLPGFFGSEVQQTVCESCAGGRYADDRGQTACNRCAAGTVTPDTSSSRCAKCIPGSFASNDSMTSCDPCSTGTFSETWGSARCRECSVAMNPGGPNANLWVTMRQELWRGRLEWTVFRGANTSNACGCAEGSWKNTAGECHTCGEGVICSGMGVVELKYGYFATHDNAGSVWRCHGRDQGRCPGGVPGVCAENRQKHKCRVRRLRTRDSHDDRRSVCGVRCWERLVVGPRRAHLRLVCWVGVYYAIVNENRAKEKEAVTFLAILGSQIFTMLQMMGVLDILTLRVAPTFCVDPQCCVTAQFQSGGIEHGLCRSCLCFDSIRPDCLRLFSAPCHNACVSLLAHALFEMAKVPICQIQGVHAPLSLVQLEASL